MSVQVYTGEWFITGLRLVISSPPHFLIMLDFNSAGFWYVILCRTENKSKICLEAEILNIKYFSKKRAQILPRSEELLRGLSFSDQGQTHT